MHFVELHPDFGLQAPQIVDDAPEARVGLDGLAEAGVEAF
jgi:hypothetical protein